MDAKCSSNFFEARLWYECKFCTSGVIDQTIISEKKIFSSHWNAVFLFRVDYFSCGTVFTAAQKQSH